MTGTWTTQDPDGFDAGDSNLNRYVQNDPTNATDSTGQYGDYPPLLPQWRPMQLTPQYDFYSNHDHLKAMLGTELKLTDGRSIIVGPVRTIKEPTVYAIPLTPAAIPLTMAINSAIQGKKAAEKIIEKAKRGQLVDVREEAINLVVGVVGGPQLQQRFQVAREIAKAAKEGNSQRVLKLLVGAAERELKIALGNIKPCEADGLLSDLARVHDAIRAAERIRAMSVAVRDGDLEKLANNLLPTLWELEKAFGPCFVAGTPIRTLEGHKLIEHLQRGNQVLSSPETDPFGPVEPRLVEEVFIRVSPVLNLHVGRRIIRVTPEHPLWVWGRGWVSAKLLEPGDKLRSDDEEWIAVEAVTDSGEVTTVYNLRVAQYHTYFVGSRKWGFSVWRTISPYALKSRMM